MKTPAEAFAPRSPPAHPSSHQPAWCRPIGAEGAGIGGRVFCPADPSALFGVRAALIAAAYVVVCRARC